MLREDAIGLIVGALVMLTGLLTLVSTSVIRRRALSLIWLGAFSFLYGLRLMIRTGTFRLYLDMAEPVWHYTDAAITYGVPIPIVLYARAIFPAWRRFWTWGALGLTSPATSMTSWRSTRSESAFSLPMCRATASPPR